MLIAPRSFRIDGTWEGHYDYPLNDTELLRRPPRVRFSMRLHESPDGVVTGNVREQPPLGFPEPGLVGGRARLFSIALQKDMPVLRLQDGDALITFAEWIQRKYPHVTDMNNVPHPTIHLTARLFRWPGSMAGVWFVPAGCIVDQRSTWRADYRSYSGGWRARRVRNAD